MAGTDAIHRRRAAAREQQLGGEPDSTDCDREVKLAVRWVAACGQTRRRGDEPGAFGAIKRAQSLRVPARCAGASAYATGQSRVGELLPHRWQAPLATT